MYEVLRANTQDEYIEDIAQKYIDCSTVWICRMYEKVRKILIGIIVASPMLILSVAYFMENYK